MKTLLLIGAGGFAGSISRYLVGQFSQKFFETSFPLGTLLVNILGSFIIGVVYALSEQSELLSVEWKIFLTVGFCGGFTTFSSFAYENFTMLNIQHFLFSALYIGVSLFLGLLAVYLGAKLVEVL